MAVPWFRVESSMVTHPKVYKLAELLKIKQAGVKPNVIAAGLIVGVWSWATQNAPSGELTGVAQVAVAEAAGWTKKPHVFFNAMIEAGFIDREGDELWLHDWINYAQKMAEQDEKKKADAAERVRKHREAKRRAASVTVTECNAPCNSYGNVTVTECNAPYITEHNITLHNREDIGSTYPIQGQDAMPSSRPSESWSDMKARIDAARQTKKS